MAGQPARLPSPEAVHAVATAALSFLEETGPHLDLARRYAWAPQGQRAYATKPRNRGRTLTWLGALGPEGIVATMSIAGGMDGVVCRSDVEQVLLPRLRPGLRVILDNLNSHNVAGIREMLEAAGARLQYLLPSSPE